MATKILKYDSLGTTHIGFGLSADVGSVTPNSATRAELLAGKSITYSDSATTITVVSIYGSCAGQTDEVPTNATTTTTTTFSTSTIPPPPD
jgi:hypothetical protein